VGPNNGGKSTFLSDIVSSTRRTGKSKWIEEISWQLGTRDEFEAYANLHFVPDPGSNLILDRRTGTRVLRSETYGFYESRSTNHHGFLIRYLNAPTRIELANRTDAPDVTIKQELHPYHSFFFNVGREAEFSAKMHEAFGFDFRINRTGKSVVGLLGQAPGGERLSEAYEEQILSTMRPVDALGMVYGHTPGSC
jgi:hypothetical protein